MIPGREGDLTDVGDDTSTDKSPLPTDPPKHQKHSNETEHPHHKFSFGLFHHKHSKTEEGKDRKRSKEIVAQDSKINLKTSDDVKEVKDRKKSKEAITLDSKLLKSIKIHHLPLDKLHHSNNNNSSSASLFDHHRDSKKQRTKDISSQLKNAPSSFLPLSLMIVDPKQQNFLNSSQNSLNHERPRMSDEKFSKPSSISLLEHSHDSEFTPLLVSGVWMYCQNDLCCHMIIYLSFTVKLSQVIKVCCLQLSL